MRLAPGMDVGKLKASAITTNGASVPRLEQNLALRLGSYSGS
jgi:hypothetical protein